MGCRRALAFALTTAATVVLHHGGITEAMNFRSYSFQDTQPTNSDDPMKKMTDDLAKIGTISSTCTVSSALTWVDKFSDVMTRFASGAFAEFPQCGKDKIQMLTTEIASSDRLMADKQVVMKVVDLLPPLYQISYWYEDEGSWNQTFSPLFQQIVSHAKMDNNPRQSQCEEAYQGVVNATSLMIRFTKDNVFPEGEDNGASGLLRGEYLHVLARFVSSVSKQAGFCVDETKLREYMNKLPSKKDGMDTSVPYPVYVDTAKYKESDAAALREFLTSSKVSVGAAAPPHQIA